MKSCHKCSIINFIFYTRKLKAWGGVGWGEGVSANLVLTSIKLNIALRSCHMPKKKKEKKKGKVKQRVIKKKKVIHTELTLFWILSGISPTASRLHHSPLCFCSSFHMCRILCPLSCLKPENSHNQWVMQPMLAVNWAMKHLLNPLSIPFTWTACWGQWQIKKYF